MYYDKWGLKHGGANYIERDIDNALYYNERALAIAEEVGEKQTMAFSNEKICKIYEDKGDSEKAQLYCKRAQALREELGQY